ncbi:MAG: nitrate reductase molybdenum cofactor assembly chaperone [Rhizobiaceae bacterium]
MNRTLKILSLFLSYPTRELQEEIPALKSALADDLKGSRNEKLLVKLANDLADLDLYDAQERYVYLFDRTRTLSLHLFEHVHGESRDRGQAMVDLKTMYERQGFQIDASELPDFLPLFLEFLSVLPENHGQELLGQICHIVTVLKERLKKRKSVYYNALVVLESLANAKPDKKLVSELLEQPDDDPDDLEALDQVWEEEAVTFGGNAGDNACGPDRLQRQIRAAARKPQNTANIQPPAEG